MHKMYSFYFEWSIWFSDEHRLMCQEQVGRMAPQEDLQDSRWSGETGIDGPLSCTMCLRTQTNQTLELLIRQ